MRYTTDKILNSISMENEHTENHDFDKEITDLGSKPQLVKLTRDGKEFFFDSTDLADHREEYQTLRRDGWDITEKHDLGAYHPARKKTIETDYDLTPDGWGYKKILTTP